jgi:spore coat protein CotH
MVANPLDDTWRRMSLVWDGETWADVAVHPSGQHSRVPGNPKPSMHLSFEEYSPSRHFHNLPSLKLNCHIDDPIIMRERITYSLERSFGIPAPREVHARVVVNGQYKGLYGVEERITKKFVERHYPGKTNQIYKFSGTLTDLDDRGPDPSNYIPVMFEVHVEDLPADAESIRDLVAVFNHGSYDTLAAMFDVEMFLREMAVETICGEEDAILAGPDELGAVWTNNFYLYKAPATGKFCVIPWDRNEDFWRQPVDQSITYVFDRHIMTRATIANNDANLARFKDLLRQLLSGPGSTEAVQARFDFIYEQIKPHMEVEPVNPMRPRSFQNWLGETAGTRDYIRQRNDGVRQQVQ